MTEPRRGTADLGETRIAYEERGPPSADAMLFLHGWMADRTGFRQQISHFKGRYRCLNPDLPGHGESVAADGDCSVAYFADRMEKFLAFTGGASEAILVGHSLGALIALDMAGAGRVQPGAAILVDPAPIRKSQAMAAALRQTGEVIATKEASAALEGLIERVFFQPGDPPALKEDIRSAAARTDVAAAEAAWAQMIRYDGRAALARAACPLLFINADKPQNREADVRTAAPDVFWGRTVGSGHFHHRVVPHQVNAMMDDFLALTRRNAGFPQKL